MLAALVVAIVSPVGPLLPSPHDKDGWGLRVHRMSRTGPFLQYEWLDLTIDVTLLNFSKETREHDPLVVAWDTGDLELKITGPDDKPLARNNGPSRPRPLLTVVQKLRPGEGNSQKFGVGPFGYDFVYQAGRYRVVATLQIGGKSVTSPPVEFEVVRVPDDAVLVTHMLPLEGAALARPVEKRHQAAIQQMKVGDRVWLVYRRFTGGGGLYFAKRVAELPGKREMTVEGAYGGWGRITITYKDALADELTKFVIHSVDGTPWTDEDEKSLQERLKREANPPPKAGKP